MSEVRYPAGWQPPVSAVNEFNRPPDYDLPGTPRKPGGLIGEMERNRMLQGRTQGQ